METVIKTFRFTVKGKTKKECDQFFQQIKSFFGVKVEEVKTEK